MSKLGFDRDIQRFKSAKKRVLRQMMNAAQKEFAQNFNTESNSETGQSWDIVVRGYPPPILDVTGQLRGETLHKGNVKYTYNYAVLTIDPIDKYGRGYAQYHQDGIGVHERAFVTQSNNLTDKQEKILDDNMKFFES